MTKRAIESRKRKFLEKIMQRQHGSTGPQTDSRADKAVERSDLDDTYTVNCRYERVMSPICCVVDDTPLEATVMDDKTETQAGAVLCTRSWRRKSVISNMNDAIRRHWGRWTRDVC